MHTGSPHSSSSEALRQRPGDCERTESLRDVDHSPRAAQRAGAVERGAGGRMVRWSEVDHSLRGAAISHAHQPAAGAPRSHHARLRAAPSTGALEAFDFCTRPNLRPPNSVFLLPHLFAMARRLVVVGGSGYIGTRIMRKALSQGLRVASVSRTGAPPSDVAQSLPGAEWLTADAQDASSLSRALEGADAVISTVGTFGSYSTMLEINGHANANIARTAASAGAKRFSYISAADFGPLERLPPLRGYFEGKRLAEKAVAANFGANGAILRPGMVHGSRRVNERISLPLHWLGIPMQLIFESSPVRSLAKLLPGGVGKLLTPPSAVDDVAAAAIQAVMDEPPAPGAQKAPNEATDQTPPQARGFTLTLTFP